MKSICNMGTIALIFSGIFSANETESKNCVTFSSEILNLAELLSYVEDTVGQLLDPNEETSLIAYHELKEGLRVIYALNCLYPEEASTILQTLDQCYAALADAADKDPSNSNILHALLLFPSGRNYEHETFVAKPLQELVNTDHSNELRSAIEATDANLVYIQDNILQEAQENASLIVGHIPTRLFYNPYSSQHSTPKILIIKSDKSPEYEVEVGGSVKLGGKDHGKFSAYAKGKVKDKNGNYAEGKISKEKGEDGCDCDVKAGKKKK